MAPAGLSPAARLGELAAGSGPDAAPFFRVFNPDIQARTFDPEGVYRNRRIAEGQGRPPDSALAWFDAVPRGWRLDPGDRHPEPAVDLATGRDRALAAYGNTAFDGG